jgi:hypothetical protein
MSNSIDRGSAAAFSIFMLMCQFFLRLIRRVVLLYTDMPLAFHWQVLSRIAGLITDSHPA